MIKTRGLSRQYGSLMAVQDVDLDIPPATIFGFIGPNGAGKTTTLRMLATLLRPTAGEIHIDGIDAVVEPIQARRRIGYMSDSFGLYDDLKVWEYLDYFCGAYEVSESSQTVDEVLDQVQLNHKRDEMVGKLSRGMRQRLGIARMLVYDPSVILLDEPANGLDPIARIALRDLLKSLRERGKTVIVSSHILTELSDFCDTVGIMELGEMIVHGSVETILARTRQHLRLVLEVLRVPDEAIALLKSDPRIVDLHVNGLKIDMGFTGTRDDIPELHRKLVGAGVPLISFFLKAENLEDLFMRLSTGATN